MVGSDLAFHGDQELDPALVDLAVNVRLTTPPPWLAAVITDTIANLGAYLSTFAPAVPTYLYATLLNGVYEMPAIHAEVTGVFTNTVPVDAYRGAGRPQGCFAMERAMDRIAQERGLDRAEVRMRNLIQADQFPYDHHLTFQDGRPVVYDSGDYAGLMDKLKALADAAAEVGAEQTGRRQRAHQQGYQGAHEVRTQQL